jgi:hypothetical protein
MVIVDSCGWLEWFADGELADAYRRYLADQDNLLVPAIILYEVYKGRGEGESPRVVQRKRCDTIPVGHPDTLPVAGGNRPDAVTVSPWHRRTRFCV